MMADAMEKRPKDVMGEKALDLETDEQEWSIYEDCTTGKIYGTKPKSNAKRGKKNGNNDVDEVPIVKIPAKYKDF